MKKIIYLGLILSLSVILIACTGNSKELDKVTIGYFPNISHGPAMVGVEKGYIEEELQDLQLNTQNFPNGSLFMDALSTKQIDMGYVGPGPVLNRYFQGGEVVIIAGASRGENVLVARKDLDINDVEDLEGKIVATPSTGCTHDLLFRRMLDVHGMAVEENGGTVKRIAQKPATMLGLFEQKQIDAAVVSEPWASLMEAQGVVEVVQEANEVPWEGKLPAAVLVVRKDFLVSNPEVVEKFIRAHEEAIAFMNKNEQETIELIANQIKEITNQEIDQDIISSALSRVEFTSEIDQNILQEFADLSKKLGFIQGDSDLGNLIEIN